MRTCWRASRDGKSSGSETPAFNDVTESLMTHYRTENWSETDFRAVLARILNDLRMGDESLIGVSAIGRRDRRIGAN